MNAFVFDLCLWHLPLSPPQFRPHPGIRQHQSTGEIMLDVIKPQFPASAGALRGACQTVGQVSWSAHSTFCIDHSVFTSLPPGTRPKPAPEPGPKPAAGGAFESA